MKKTVPIRCITTGLVILLLPSAMGWAQNVRAVPPEPIPNHSASSSERPSTAEQAIATEAGRAVLAMSISDYPVTPGDVYLLSYLLVNQPVTVDLIVEHNGRINLGPFGHMDANGLTFVEARRRIEARVREVYPAGVPRLVIRSLGLFQISLSGEVTRAGFAEADGLTRLSSLVASRATEVASTRSVRVRPADGSERVYDLFLYHRDGDLTQNPYIRPNDELVLERAARRVTLSGQIYRPGEYQLLPGETLADLLQRYGDGIQAPADLSEVQIDRVSPEPGRTTETFTVDLNRVSPESVALQNRDQVVIPGADRFRPVLFLEVVSGTGGTGGSAGSVNRTELRFTSGERLAEIVRRAGDLMPVSADLSAAYLVRAGLGGVISIDLRRFLFEREPPGDLVVEPGDRLVIPVAEEFVIVSGAVRLPGRQIFVPGRTYQFYLQQAGGIDPLERWGSRPIVRDSNNRRRSLDQEIQPEDRIHFRTNSPLFYAAPVATIVSTVATIFLLTR